MTVVRRRVALLAAVLALAGVLAACNRSKVEGEGRLDPDGRILLTRKGDLTTVSRSRSLVAGDTIEVAEGMAKVALPGGDVIELRPSAVVVLDRGIDLRRGAMLVTAEAAPRTLRAAGSQVEVSGAVRLDATLALRVAIYRGYAVVTSGGRTYDVAALREASVPVAGLFQGPRPLAIDENDAWDQRYLGDAASKGPELESRARGFTGQVASANATSPAYYRSVLPGLAAEPDFQQDRLGRLGRPAGAQPGERFRAGDVLLGAAVALQGKRGSFAQRFDAAVSLRSQGASWSLIAVDQQVPSIDGLLRLIDGAVNAAPLELAAPGAPARPVAVVEPPPARPTATAPPSRRVTTTTTRPATRSTTPTTTTPTTLPPQQPQPPEPGTIVLPVDPLLDAITDPVVDLLNSLLGGGR